jgi:hypothetical protein
MTIRRRALLSPTVDQRRKWDHRMFLYRICIETPHRQNCWLALSEKLLQRLLSKTIGSYLAWIGVLLSVPIYS